MSRIEGIYKSNGLGEFQLLRKQKSEESNFKEDDNK